MVSQAFLDDVYKGDMEPRPDSQADDVAAVIIKVDSQRSFKNNTLEKVRQQMSKSISKKHGHILVGSLDLVGEESMARFKYNRRPLGGRIENKAPNASLN